MSHPTSLRTRLRENRLIVAPGAYDALTARLVEKHGFEAVYMTGLGATAARLGQPDLGLMTQTEMADCARAMTSTVTVPVIADADTGYGGVLNVARTVHEYIKSGVAGLHIEDQASPKRCGQLAGIQLVGHREAKARLTAAIEARGDNDIVIIGRTDALPALGMNEAIERAKCYRDTGVDLVFVDGVKTRKEVEKIANQLEGPKVLSIVDGTDAAKLKFSDIDEMGFSVVLYAVSALFSAVRASSEALTRLANNHKISHRRAISYAEFCELVDMKANQDFAHRHGG